MRDFRTPEQTIRAIMEGQANAATLEYGTDLARDTYADDTPGQEPGEHTGKFQPVLANKTATAVDGVPKKGGEMVKPNPERLAGLGQKESYKGNPYLQMAKSDIIQENAYDQFVEMSDVEFDDMIDVLTIEELNDLEEGIISGTGKLIGSAAKGVGKLALGTVKLAGKGIMAGGKAAANRMSTKGRADAAEKKLKKLQQKKKDKERLAKAKQGIDDLKGKPISWGGRESVRDSRALGSRDYWTETDEQDLTEGKMSKAEVKKHAAAIFKMRQQKQADAAASKALSKPKSAAAKAARRDAADAGYGTPMSDPADRDVRHKGPEGQEKRGRGQKDLPHIVSQLRGVVDTKDGAPSKVKFKDGTTKDVKPKHAQAWLNKHDSAKPHQKLDMYKSHDSHKAFKSYAKEAVDAEDAPKLKKLIKGLKGSSAGHKAQAKDIEKMIKDEKEFKVKNCGCGEDPCKTYGSKEEQMKDMQEAPGQRAWDRSSKGRAYRRLSDEEKARLLKKNELMRRAKAMKGDDAAYSTSRMRKPTLGGARQTYKGKKTRREHNEMMEGIILGIEAKLLLENKEKCGPGEYWCTKDMKCKPIPKGMTTDKNGMLVKEEKMAGVEYYPRMKKHGKMTDAQKKAVTAVYDKKKIDKKMADDPHVKKAQRYMKVEQAINELDSKTLKDYIRKAASPVNKPSAINLASKGGFKLGRSDDLDAGEKEDRKAFNRGRGIQRAAKKLYKRTNEESSWVQRVADDWNDHADHPHPKVQKHIKKAEKAYNDNDYERFHHHTNRAADHAYSLRQKKKPNVQPKGAMGGPKKINHNPNKTNEAFNYKAMAKDYLSKNKGKKHSVDSVQAHLKATEHEYDTHQSVADKHGHNAGETMYHVKKMTKKPVNNSEAFKMYRTHGVKKEQDRLIRQTFGPIAYRKSPQAQAAVKKFKKAAPSIVKKTVAATRPKPQTMLMKKPDTPKPGGNKFASPKVNVPKVQNRTSVNEISDKMKVDYINKANKEITKSEKQLAKAHSQGLDKNALPGLHKRKEDEIKKRREGVRLAKSKLGEMSMSVTLKPKKNNMYKVTKVGDKMKKHGGIKKGEHFHDSEIDGMHDSGIKVKYHKEALSPKAQKAVKVIGIAANPGLAAKKVVADKLVGGISKGIKKIQARRYARKMGASKMGQSQPTKPITNKASQVKHSSTPPGAKPQFEGKMQRRQHLQTTMKPLVKTLATPMAGPAAGAAAAVGALAGKGVAKKLMKAPSTIKKTIKAKTSFGPKKIGEASAAEVLKKRYASYHPDDNPQATRKLRDDEHDQPKGANVYKMHPGAKLTDRGYSKKGKMAALKKQHERRPEKYGITRESYAARIAEKMNYPKSAVADMNKMADKSDKDWWKAQDKAKQREDSNKAKIDKINNMGTRHGT